MKTKTTALPLAGILFLCLKSSWRGLLVPMSCSSASQPSKLVRSRTSIFLQQQQHRCSDSIVLEQTFLRHAPVFCSDVIDFNLDPNAAAIGAVILPPFATSTSCLGDSKRETGSRYWQGERAQERSELALTHYRGPASRKKEREQERKVQIQLTKTLGSHNFSISSSLPFSWAHSSGSILALARANVGVGARRCLQVFACISARTKRRKAKRIRDVFADSKSIATGSRFSQVA